MAATRSATKLMVTYRVLEKKRSAMSYLLSRYYHGHQRDSVTDSKEPVSGILSNCQRLCRTISTPLITSSRNISWYVDKRISGNLGAVGIAEVDLDVTAITDGTEGQELASMVNTALEQKEEGRLFAVVYISGVQRRVTAEDILVIETEFPPTVGDRLRLEKVLMVGGKDFSLIGQPLLSRDQVRVEATVVEKTLSHNRIWSTYKRRKRFRVLKLYRTPFTMLLINSIQLNTIPQQ